MALVLKYFDIIGPCNFNSRSDTNSLTCKFRHGKLYGLKSSICFTSGRSCVQFNPQTRGSVKPNTQTIYICCQFVQRAITCVVVVCTDFSGREPHRQVDVGRMVTSQSLGGVIVNTPTWNAGEGGSIPALGAIFPIFITTRDTGSMTRTVYKLHTVSLLNLCMYMYGHFVVVSINRLIIPGGRVQQSALTSQARSCTEMVVPTGNLGGVMVSSECRRCGFDSRSSLGTIFSISVTSTTLMQDQIGQFVMTQWYECALSPGPILI